MAVASRFLLALSGLTQALGTGTVADDADLGSGVSSEVAQEYALVDVDDTIIEVHGHTKQGAGFGYTRVRGLNALLATLTTTVPTTVTAPLVVAQRLRKGACNSARGAKRLVGDAVKTTRRMLGQGNLILVRMDSAFYGRGPVLAALAGGAQVSVTVRMNAQIRAAIASIADDGWTTIEYTDAVYDEASRRWVSRAEVAEIRFTAFGSGKKAERVRGRLVVRRIPDFNAEKKRAAGQDTLFDVWRFHAFFTTADPTILDTVAADKTHRAHAIIEQVHADLKGSALAHLPSGVFTANAAWLVLAVMAFNLTRIAGTLSGPELAKATTATIRRKLINVPARGRRPGAPPCHSRTDVLRCSIGPSVGTVMFGAATFAWPWPPPSARGSVCGARTLSGYMSAFAPLLSWRHRFGGDEPSAHVCTLEVRSGIGKCGRSAGNAKMGRVSASRGWSSWRRQRNPLGCTDSQVCADTMSLLFGRSFRFPSRDGPSSGTRRCANPQYSPAKVSSALAPLSRDSSPPRHLTRGRWSRSPTYSRQPAPWRRCQRGLVRRSTPA